MTEQKQCQHEHVTAVVTATYSKGRCEECGWEFDTRKGDPCPLKISVHERGHKSRPAYGLGSKAWEDADIDETEFGGSL